MIPYSTSLKNQVFVVFTPKTLLRKDFAGFWSGCRRLRSFSRRHFGSSLAILTAGPVSKIGFVHASGGVRGFSCVRMVCREACGCIFRVLWLFRVAFVEIFDRTTAEKFCAWLTLSLWPVYLVMAHRVIRVKRDEKD